VFGGSGNDLVSGGAGDDDLSTAMGSGEAGDDTLLGGSGNDNVVDCIGHNRLDGGPDTDLCVFSPQNSSGVNCETISSTNCS
jgi:Ca2+-binding RTX toxin-like protein